MAEDNSSQIVTRFEKLEERLRNTETDVASLAAKLESSTTNLKEDIGHTRVDLRERISDLKQDIKEDFKHVSISIDALSANITTVNESLQNLYITNSGSAIKINLNERIIWILVGIISTGGLYLLQDFLIKAGGGS